MKKNLFLLFLIISFISEGRSKKYEGYYVTWQNDTIKTTFKMKISFGTPAIEKIQWKGVKYYDKNGKLQKFKPGDIKEFYYLVKDYTYRIYTMEGKHLLFLGSLAETKPVFLHLRNEGKN